MKSWNLPARVSRWLATRGPLILRWLTWGIAICAMGLVIYGDHPPQDLLPFQAAARLVSAEKFDAIYPVENAGSLFDVHPEFHQSSLRIAGERYANLAVTAYVAPPPALLIGRVLPANPTDAAKIWRLIIASVVLLSLLALERNLRRTRPEALVPWHLMMAGILPLLLYGVYLGQTSALLLAVATATVLPPGKARDFLGGGALGAVAVTKIFPLAIIPAVAVMGGRRIAVVSLLLVLAACATAVACWPLSLWGDFFNSICQMSRYVIADWNNASLDAGLTALATFDVSSTFILPPLSVRIAGALTRSLLAGSALILAVRRRDLAPENRWPLLWVALLAALPLLWSHYLICLLPPLQASLKTGARVTPVLLAWGLSAGFMAKGHLPLMAISTITVTTSLITAMYLIVTFARRRRFEQHVPD